MINVKIADKLGYCSGVSQAIQKAQQFGDKHRPVYSLGTVAHNDSVVALLKQHGVEPISTEELKMYSDVVITAHGAPPELYFKLLQLQCPSLDCTCPIVKKAQAVVEQLQREGFDIVIFGDPDHQEVQGLAGWAGGNAKFVGTLNQLFNSVQNIKPLGLGRKIGVVSQTTQVPEMYADFLGCLIYNNVGEFQEVRIFNTICPTVVQRIKESRKLAGEVDLMIVVGSHTSANTQNLAMVCKQVIKPENVFIVQDEDEVGAALASWHWENDRPEISVGVTAGTSTPIEVVDKVVAKLKETEHAG